MGRGIDLAREGNPIHAAMLDDFKDQLLIMFLKRLGGVVDIPLNEVNDTGQDLLSFSVDEDKVFHFILTKKS